MPARDSIHILICVALLPACGGAAGDVIVARGGACTPEAQRLFLIDGDGRLGYLQADGPSVVDIGALACPAQGGCPGAMGVAGAGPIAMAVERDTRTARCEPAGAAPSFERFTTTFVATAAGDTLFVAGASASAPVPAQFAAASVLSQGKVPGFAVERVADLRGWPALAETGDGQLWAQFPPGPAGGPRVAELDPRDGAERRAWPAPAPAAAAQGGFAFWGASRARRIATP